MSKDSLCLLVTLLFGYSTSFTQPTDAYYLRADMDEPWCCGWAPYPNSNPQTLDAVFGPGGWSLSYFEYADANAIFNDNTCYVFMEGGEGHTDYMESFFSTNQTLIEQWVFNGGSLFINAAPNVGDGLSCGFGDVWLWYPYAWPGDVMYGTDALTHPIWNGPFTPLALEMWGPSYSHGYVTGSGLTPLIVDTYTPDQWVLSEKSWGMGHVFFGTMTTASWHWPNTECVNIRQNMHSYMYLMCGLILSEGLLNFTAHKTIDGAQVKWQTTDTKPGYYFEVAKSRNGNDWELFAMLTANELNTYSLNDTKPFNGKSYYRLSYMDDNGNTKEQKIAPIEIATPLEIYPIPADNYFVVETAGAESSNYTLLSASGQKMQIDIHTGIDEVLIKIAHLPAGIYLLQIDQNDARTYSRIIID